MANKTYDRDYFERWYRRGGIGGAQRLARKVALAVATAEYHLERPVRSVLDIGCGEGAWRAPLLKLRPKARYLGFDSSEYAITRHGASRNLHYARFGDFAQLRPTAPVPAVEVRAVVGLFHRGILSRPSTEFAAWATPTC